ncbi:MAG TPA: lysylphosphatidylglycerol synthase transmembrane domain-containing protein [Gaiellaceae bacterium]|nr:lysylphosphatidylglycerol synthase transmembrane domain-containing protein [Gaiellaceae bacterium]
MRRRGETALRAGRLRGHALTLVGIAVTAALVAVAARAIDPGEVVEGVRSSDARWLAPAVAAFCAAALLRATRWRAMFVAGERPRLRAVLAAMLVGDLFNNVLPARAGEAARVFALHARSGVSRAQIVATVVLERVFDVLVLLLMLAVALPLLPDVTWLRAAAWLGAAVGVAAVAAVVVLRVFGERPLRALLRPLRRVRFVPRDRLEQAPENAVRGLAALTRPSVAAAAAALTAAAWSCVVVCAWLLTRAFDLDVPPGAALLVTVATALGMTVPSAPASLGVFEAAAVVALAAFGVPAPQALSYALVLHALMFATLVAGGLAVLAWGRVSGLPRPRPG